MKKILLVLFPLFIFAQKIDIEQIEKDSMLYQSIKLAEIFSGKKDQWQNTYGMPKTKEVCEKTSVWFTSYSPAIITDNNQSVLQVLGSKALWDILKEMGIQALHTGPMKLSGGIIDGKTDSVDGGFDRISYEVDPLYGNQEQYLQMVKIAKENNSIIIGDLIPGHTGLGADFLLALMNYKDYPGIYHMVEIDKKDWNLLPEVKEDKISINLPMSTVEKLKNLKYIVGPLETQIFFAPNIKVSNWDATRVFKGTDNIERRWVYLHYFKAGQPSLNWLDPSAASYRLIFGDIVDSLSVLQNSGVRLDANPYLGVELQIGEDKAWSEGHPLAVVSTNLLSMMIRKLGGFSFQELNLSVPDIRMLSELGADFSYDFITRSAYTHALIAQDADFLRIMVNLMTGCNISPINFIHALQNHDEFNYDLAHFQATPDEIYSYKNKKYSGKDFRDLIINQDHTALVTDAPYNMLFGNGIASTMVGMCAAALKIKDLNNLTQEDKENIKKAHLLLAFFNAMQPGVFAFSGWDLLGAYPLSKEDVKALIDKDADTRWINRGAYDLLGTSKNNKSHDGLIKAKSLYGPIPIQLKDPNSFASQLKVMIAARKANQLDIASPYKVFEVKHPQLFIAAYQLPSKEILISFLNFGRDKVEEEINLDAIKKCRAINIITNNAETKDYISNSFKIELNPLEAKAIVFKE